MGGTLQKKQLICYTVEFVTILGLLTRLWQMAVLISNIIQQVKLLENEFQSENPTMTQ